MMDRSEQQIAAKKPRGKPFLPGDPRIDRQGVPNEAVALAKAVRETEAEILFGPCPRHPNKMLLVCILDALAGKAERGDVRAAEILLDRIGGKPTQPEADGSGRGDITIVWAGAMPEWAKPAAPLQPVSSLPSHPGDVPQNFCSLPVT